mmetsp:Transcript_970/g.2493  ORF Transcript_970/g.2493 Transcript_970/m.2493 type:complete len:138 (+) Transcript_970:107-520(+)
MMFRTSTLFLLFSAAALFLSSSSVNAFSVQPGRSVQGAQQLHSNAAAKKMPASILKMSEGSSEKEDVASKISADGTFYDDEIDSAPIKTGISDSMKQRLMAEAATGLDSETKQTNVILYVCVAVAVLVALAGQGILY